MASVTCHPWPSNRLQGHTKQRRSSALSRTKTACQSRLLGSGTLTVVLCVSHVAAGSCLGTRDSRSLTYTFPEPTSLAQPPSWFQVPRDFLNCPPSPTLGGSLSGKCLQPGRLNSFLFPGAIHSDEALLQIFCPEKDKYF